MASIKAASVAPVGVANSQQAKQQQTSGQAGPGKTPFFQRLCRWFSRLGCFSEYSSSPSIAAPHNVGSNTSPPTGHTSSPPPTHRHSQGSPLTLLQTTGSAASPGQLAAPDEHLHVPVSHTAGSDTQCSTIANTSSQSPSGETATATSTTDSASRPTYEIKVDELVPGQIYQIKKEKTGRFYGKLNVFPPPKGAVEELDQDLVDKIRVDFEEFEEQLSTQGSNIVHNSTFSDVSFSDSFEIVVEMSGFSSIDGTVTLYPGLRIVCHDSRDYQLLTKAVSTVVARWLPSKTIFKHIHVEKPETRGANDGKAKNDTGLSAAGLESSELLEGLEVQFEVGNLVTASTRDSYASATIICRASLYRNGEKTDTRFSRVSGPLLINGHQVYVTTAHQIVDMIVSSQQHSRAETTSQPSDGDDGASIADQDAMVANPDFLCPTRPAVDFASEVKEWAKITPPCNARYGRLEIRHLHSGRSKVVLSDKDDIAAPDCIVLGVQRQPKPPSTGPQPVEVRRLEDPEQSVRVLLDGPSDEQSLQGFTCVQVRGAASARSEASTILLCLDVALPPGSSGASVEKDGIFVGMIVASYQDEPMAHMIGAGRIAAYIGRVLHDSSVDTTQPDLLHGLGDISLPRLMRGFLHLPGSKRQDTTPRDLSTHSDADPSDRMLQWRNTLSSDNSEDVKAALASRQINEMASTESPLPSPRLLFSFLRRGSDMSIRSRTGRTALSEGAVDETVSPVRSTDEMALRFAGTYLSHETNVAEMRSSDDGGISLLGQEATRRSSDGGSGRLRNLLRKSTPRRG